MGRDERVGARTRAPRVIVAAVVALAGVGIASGAGAGTALVSRTAGEVGNGYSEGPVISRDGRFVAFTSLATNLVTSPPPSGQQLYLHDRTTGANEMLSVSATGDPADRGSNSVAISHDGAVAVFNTMADNIAVPDAGCNNGRDRHGNPRQCFSILARDRVADTTTVVSRSWNGEPTLGTSGDADVSADGRYVVFNSFATNLVPDDTNGQGDVFLRDLQSGTTTLLSVAGDGTQGNGQSLEPVISADGRFVAFSSGADNLAPGADSSGTIYVVDRTLGTITAHGVDGVHTGGSYGPGISDDGGRLVYFSYSTLVPEDTNPSYDTYTEDVATGAKALLAIDDSGALVPGSDRPAVSGDGAYVTFRSRSVRAQDTGAVNHVYRRRVADGAVDLVTQTEDGREVQTGTALGPRSISVDGRFAVFGASDPLVVANDTNNDSDVFVRDFGAPPESASGTGVADTDTESDGATYLDPVETTVTGPAGSTVSIDEVDATRALPDGFAALGQQADVHVTPGGTVADPIVLTFRFDASLLPPDADESTVHLFRNGVEVPACAGAPSAVPDPCVSDRALAADGDVIVTARSSAASAWNGATIAPRDTDPPRITMSAPTDGATYVQHRTVTAQYSCADDVDPVPTCSGDVPSGTAIDTSGVGAHTFHIHASDATGNAADTTVAYTVVTDESVSIGHATVVEGDSSDARSLTFSVTLNRPADHAVSVRYASAPGSATAGSDYTSRAGTLKFSPSAKTGTTPTTKFVTVPIRGDGDGEGDEYFTVGLTNPSGGYHLGADTADGVIVDDDATTGLRVGIGDATVREGDAGVTNTGKVWVTLSAPVTGASVTVRLTPAAAGATSGADHKVLKARTLKFTAGQWRKAVSVAVLPDTAVEGSESLLLVLSQPSPGLAIVRDTGTLTIADDD